MNKISLVTGGGGFIGSHLCEILLEKGNDVICLDNFFTGSKRNIDHLCRLDNFEIIRHDICDPFIIEADEIYNLACPASPFYYQYDPVKTIKTNVQGTINVLESARKTGAKVLQASTSEIYGDPLISPQIETYWGNVNPIGIRSCYDEGKRCAETLFFDYHRQYGLEIKVARIFNTYGSNMSINDGRVVSNFIVQSLRDEDITIYGEGKQTRSFCYVDDTVWGMIKLMESKKDITGPINLGNPHEINILELAHKIILMTNSKSKIVYRSLPEDDPQRRNPDIELAIELIDWFPDIKLEEGMDMTIDYFRKII
ncbi:MAG: UDP-glucuronic acid decarboxylase family protein [Candidatus Asgardarchaeia archaeon]